MERWLFILSLFFPSPDPNPPTPEQLLHHREFYCAALTVFGESHGESLLGQFYVAASIRNRLEDGRWPDTLCGVTEQPGQYIGLTSWKLPRTPWKIDPVGWGISQAVVQLAMFRFYDDDCSRRVLYFNSTPFKGFKLVCKLGGHYFYGDNHENTRGDHSDSSRDRRRDDHVGEGPR